ncbi:type II toxin-antitoxin system RelE/ParE family toxin [Aquimarina sp. MMG016]|uniref:type II toxin-antitoxin system RelE/ParE family toxin n=1 Tax=Aquimarina sp. MMG016 TaxID=2822690 RepID=UPI001B3A3BBD|nr:type II toxin-antitoxin system RelE/ParE family toxin [Aquimarina sp. MMG016]MBQ4822069.1 type II toxin-antitoxin system RelE/ParE family toxin [Aquimarina sp. MMG016]
MIYKLILKRRAEIELEDAIEWYNSLSKGLGFRFLNSVRSEINYIQKFPKHFQISKNTFRQAPIQRFPFIIVYEIENNTIIVYSIFNTNQNPIKKPG